MRLDESELVLRQPRGLREDLGRDGDLADVVDQGREHQQRLPADPTLDAPGQVSGQAVAVSLEPVARVAQHQFQVVERLQRVTPDA